MECCMAKERLVGVLNMIPFLDFLGRSEWAAQQRKNLGADHVQYIGPMKKEMKDGSQKEMFLLCYIIDLPRNKKIEEDLKSGKKLAQELPSQATLITLMTEQ
ncbi:hypothetical protein P5673_033057 [Acropora cervicornis]|uniref:Uncharacterized protein n=1 Tax=Acropora cervicornis TaxID=6130 RepID=A0AAD9PQF4_ACRCE|nr:hypothetical protein P5673_033057 [Acropora cervicornis]